MKKLVPILTGEENESSFLDKVTENCDKLILLHVVQRDEVEDVPAGFAGSRIKSGEDLMDEIAEEVSSYLEVEKMMEWGEVGKKVAATAKLNDVDEVWMKKSKKADEISEKLEGFNLHPRIEE